jgi:hypothetical protein
MKIRITKSGITFGSLVKLVSIGYLIGMGVLSLLGFVLLSHFDRGGVPAKAWIIFPVLIAFQSLLTGVVVAAGFKLYTKLDRCKISCDHELQQAAPADRQ